MVLKKYLKAMVWQLWAYSFILLVAAWVHTAPKHVVLIFYETVIQHLEIKSEVIFWQCFNRIGPYIEYRYTFNHGQTGRRSYTLAWFAKMGHYVGLNTRKKKCWRLVNPILAISTLGRIKWYPYESSSFEFNKCT